MKHEKILTILVSGLLAFFTAWGAIGCMVSAFSLPLEDPRLPGVVCGGCALLFSALLSCRYGEMAVLLLLAPVCGYIYHDGTAAGQLMQLVQQLSTIYHRAYGWGILELPEALRGAAHYDWPMAILGGIIALAVALCVCRQKSVWLPVGVTLLPLCSCIVVTDTVPGEVWLYMVMAGLTLLILTTAVRREQATQGLRLTAMAALPVLLALCCLFLAIPQESYVNHSAVLRENLITAARHMPQLVEGGMNDLAAGLRAKPPKQVDLAGLGERLPFTYPVMEVTAQKSGTLYLRGQDYDQYDGFGWTATAGREEVFSGPGGETETIRISTRNRKAIRYLPYYPAEGAALKEGAVEHPDQEQTYTLLRTQLPEDWRQLAYAEPASHGEDWSPYLSLPEDTRQGAIVLLETISGTPISNTAKADIIAALVMDGASYDTQPNKMPAGEPDFALWFLNTEHRGYCVHFATAATVLLRAAGVPARYVTGYMTEVSAGETVTVTEENAHAWAEFYEPNLGLWLPLETTPASETVVVSQPVQIPEVTEATDPTETTQSIPEAVTEAPLLTESEEELAKTEATVPVPPPEEPDDFPLTAVLILPVLAMVLAVQRSIRLSLRRRRQRTGPPNRQALHRWQEAVRLSRLLKESPTEELIVLAEKAKFSQYELGEEELARFDSFIRSCLRRLKEKPIYMQLIYQYLYAVF